MDEYKLTFGLPDPIVIDNLPLSNWTIVNTDTLSINGDTITQLGIGGWYESMFVPFTVAETGSYKISYDYNITTAKVGNHGTYGFGLWLTTNNPNVSGTDQSSFYNDSSNRTGFVIGVQNEDISGKHGKATFDVNLVAGTTYYLWYPGAALDDGTTYTLTFTNIRVYNNPIQYTYNNILSYPNWNGYLEYICAVPNYYFTIQDTHDQVQTYVKYTTPNGATGELTNPTGAGTATITTSLPEATILTGYTISNTYYRNSVKQTGFGDFVSAKTTSEPRKKTFTATLTGDSTFGTSNTQANNVSWTWTFSNNSKPNWYNNNGGILQCKVVPSPGRITINSCYPDGSAYCCRTLSDSNSGYWRGCTAKKNSPTNSYYPTQRIAALDSNTWKNVWQSAQIAMTGYAAHGAGYWTSTASNGGQRGLKANYLINSTQEKDPGKNINNNFYSMANTTKTTSFNVAGTGTNMPATNWNNQTVLVYATIGFNTDNTGTYANKYPVNQITGLTATVKCSAWLP